MNDSEQLLIVLEQMREALEADLPKMLEAVRGIEGVTPNTHAMLIRTAREPLARLITGLFSVITPLVQAHDALEDLEDTFTKQVA